MTGPPAPPRPPRSSPPPAEATGRAPSARHLGASQRASGLGRRLPPAGARDHPASGFDEVPRSVSALHAFVELVDRARNQRIRTLLVLVALNLADIGTTVWFLARGGQEANPLVAPIVQRWWLLLILKLMVLAILARGVLGAPPRSASARRLLVAAACYYLVVVASNLRVIARL